MKLETFLDLVASVKIVCERGREGEGVLDR
jgi:hypothetical protein